jgi:hypothetical protein
MRSIIFSVLCFVLFSLISSAQVTATVNGNTVMVRDANFSWSCSGVFFQETRFDGDTITVTEVDTMRVATCTCQFSVATSISGLTPGTYTAKVFRQHRLHLRYPVDTLYISTLFAGSASFIIVQNPDTTTLIQFHQSGCGVGPGRAANEWPLIPAVMSLECFPNPFNPATTIRYSVPTAGIITLAVYDMSGKCVDVISNEWKEVGVYECVYDLRKLSSGPYVCRLMQGKNAASAKMLLVK